jgi:hypothetical protein
MGVLVLLVALSISGVAAWYSIAGLAAIFAAAQIPIIIMGGVLEVGKLVTASWLYQNWKEIPFLLKSYLTIAVVVLMFITSMGIFGFLSKAHIDQTVLSGDNTLLVQQLDNRIARQNKVVRDNELVIAQLDGVVQILMDADRVRGNSGAIAVRNSQKEERDELNQNINEASNIIFELQSEKLKLQQEQNQLEAEVGPIKYIAELFYQEDTTKDMLEEAVRWVIIIIVFVFDPLAVLLLVAANMSLIKSRNKIKTKQVAAFNDISQFNIESREIEEDEEFANMTPSQIDMEIEAYKNNPKSQREGTYINRRYKKLVAYKKILDSK